MGIQYATTKVNTTKINNYPLCVNQFMSMTHSASHQITSHHNISTTGYLGATGGQSLNEFKQAIFVNDLDAFSLGSSDLGLTRVQAGDQVARLAAHSRRRATDKFKSE
jgi:hypothetical protein